MRVHDWPERLTAVLVASRDRAFVYGAHDCCTHAADCIEAVTGADIAAAWRGRYASQEAGLRLAKVRSLAALAGRSFAPIAPVFARRGDLAIAPVGVRRNRRREPMLFVVDGAVLRGPAGAVIARGHATQAWRVD